MECLVTGAGGFVGRAVIEALSEAGWSGLATGRAAPAGLPPGWRGWQRDDLLARPDAARPRAIVHLESRSPADDAPEGDGGMFDRVNVGGTREWLEWAAAAGTRRFVLVGSILAVVPADGPRTEEAPLVADDSYGGSKARAEAVLREWCAADAGRRGVILRSAPVYGPDERSNLLPFVRRVIAGKPVVIGEGRAVRSIVSRRNLAAAVVFALSRDALPCEVFNVADARPVTLAELAAMVASAAGVPVPRRVPAWAATLAAPVGDLATLLTGRPMPIGMSRLRASRVSIDFPCDRLVAAGFRHAESTRDGLARMVDWIRSLPDSGQ